MPLQNSWNSSIPISTAQGGTGYTTYSKGDKLIGNASGSLTTLAVGMDGYALIADSTQTLGMKWASVAMQAVTFNGNTGSATPLNNVLAVSGTSPISISGSGNTLTAALGIVPVSLGGTGTGTLDNGIVIGQNGAAVRTLKVTSNQVVSGNATGDAQSKNLTSQNGSIGIAITDSSIDLSLTSQELSQLMPWFTTIAATDGMTVTNGQMIYVNSTSPVTLKLSYDSSQRNPALKIVGTGSSNWTLSQNGQTALTFGNQKTGSTSGTLASTLATDSLEMTSSSIAPGSWFVTSSQGNFNIN